MKKIDNTKLLKNSIHQIEITDYSHQADGVGKIDGLAVFVKGALIGETVEIKITKVTKNCAWARLNKIIKASPNRIKPDCKYYKRCGGCRLRHLNYEEELAYKLNRVNSALKRIAKTDFSIDKIWPSNLLHYRNKGAFPISKDKNGNTNIGLYQERSHDVINIDNCKIQSKEANEIIQIVRLWIKKFYIEIYDEKSHKGLLRHILIRTNHKSDTLICLVSTSPKIPNMNELINSINNSNVNCKGILINVNNKNTNVILGEENILVDGQNYITDKLCDLEFKLSVPSFFQINRSQAEKLYKIAIEFAHLNQDKTILDLYCGTGTITLLMAKQAKKAIGIEIVNEAIEDAKQNATINKIKNTEFICANAADGANQIISRNIKIDTICCDPPRKGLDSQSIESILKIAPKSIVYVSCDPATLARDLKIFTANNYNITKGQAIDMFPRTAHVETVMLLEKII